MIRDSIIAIIGDLKLAEKLVSSIKTNLLENIAEKDIDSFVLSRFEKSLYSIIPEVNGHPAGELLKLLIREESERTNAEIIKCLEFIYSHMVSKFQGDLAEFLSLMICSEMKQEWKLKGKLPPEAMYIWGNDILERKRTRPSTSDENAWYKGADGLFIVDQKNLVRTSPSTFETSSTSQDTNLYILGVVEVKSYAISYQRAANQIEKHLARLQGGLKIADQEWPPERLYFMRWNPKSELWIRTPVIGATHPDILRLLIKPLPTKSPKISLQPSLPPNTFERTLPYTKKMLAAAAYHMTVWFIENLGSNVFTEQCNPWPDFTPEEAGVNAIKEALYHIILRNLPKRQDYIATRLYNVYGFGYENAENHKDMIWSVRDELVSKWQEPAPTINVHPAMRLDEVIDYAWSFYRRGYMAEALAYIDAAMLKNPDESTLRRLKWLQGMIHYFSADFEQALELLPSPTADRQNDWWARDKLTLAYILARLGRTVEAIQEIEQVSDAKLRDKFLLVSIPVCEAMVFISLGQNQKARQRLNVAFRNLETIRSEREERNAHEMGEPLYYNSAAIEFAAVQMATGFVMLSELKTAMHILSHVRYVSPPTLLLVARDTALDALRDDSKQSPKFQTWIEARQREVGLKIK